MMKKELRLVMDEKTTACITEVIKDWDKEAEELGFPSDGRIASIIQQLEREKERLFKSS